MTRKQKFILSLVGIFVVGAVLLMIFWPRPGGCLTPPPTAQWTKDSPELKLVAELETVLKSVDVKAAYERQVTSNFGKLSDENAELYLYLKAIECYLMHGTAASEKVAQGMADTLRATKAVKHGIQGLEAKLSDTELAKIDQAPKETAAYIRAEFKRWGY